MAGNSFGDVFRITTFGESHGLGIGVVIDGCPPGIELSEAMLQEMLDRRRPNALLPTSTTRSEADRAVIYSGIFNGKTTGTPIMIMVANTNAKPQDYSKLASVFRPGHGDFTYDAKYGLRDYRGGGRASGRETIGRVAAGAVAREVLRTLEISVTTKTLAMGPISPEEAKAQGDTLGGVVEIIAENLPTGLGEPVFDKLDAKLAQALMSIGAVKGVEIGAGFSAAGLLGSQNNDAITPDGFASNHAGGVLAGISNGEPLVMRVAVKPIPSIAKEQSTIDQAYNPQKISIDGRHDISAIPRINVVCEAMVYLVLADMLLRQRAIV